MSIADDYVGMNEGIVSWLGDAHTLAHVHAGLAIYIAVQFFAHDRRASIHGLIWVAGAAIANEMLEAVHYGSMRWEDTTADVLITVLWPAILYTVGRYRRHRWNRWLAVRGVMRAARGTTEQSDMRTMPSQNAN